MIHNEIVLQNIEYDMVIGSSLISMYTKLGLVHDAYKVFNSFPHRNVVLWNNMLEAVIEDSNSLPQSSFFMKMQQEGVHPDKVMYISILKACEKLGLLKEGRLIHGRIIISINEVDSVLGSTLISMYSRCGSLDDAGKVYEDLACRDLVILGAMIAAYVEEGFDQCALELFIQMLKITDRPDKGTVFYVLRACSNLKALQYVQLLHDQMIRARLESDSVLTNTLVDSYCKCEDLVDACQVFGVSKKCDVVSFGIMMAGYIQHGFNTKSLELFLKMVLTGLRPDESTYISSLKASCNINTLETNHCIHYLIVHDGWEFNPAVGKALIETYSKLKCLEESYNVFRRLLDQKVALWSAMMTSYVEQGYEHEAIGIFDRMQKELVVLDSCSLMQALKACTMLKDSGEGKIVHSIIMIHGFDEDEAFQSSVINMYLSCNKVHEGLKVFESSPQQNVVTWSVLISRYAESGCSLLAFELFNNMLQKGLQPDRVIFLSILKACTTSGTIIHGKFVHHQIIKHGLFSDVLGNALIDMYGKNRSPMEAQNVFDRLHMPNIISWTSIVAAHADGGNLHGALSSFETMQKEGMEINVVTFLCTIKACSNASVLQEGRLLHSSCLEFELHDVDAIASALINMYAKCDIVEDAYAIFNHLSNPDVVTWGSMITALVQHGREFSAFKLFNRMQAMDVNSSTAIFLCVLKACSNVGAIVQGRWVHDQILRSEYHSDSYLGNALVSMYASFGSMDEAHNVFSKLLAQDNFAWQAMISGFSKQGDAESVSNFLEQMQRSGLHPLETTYSSILACCSHSGHIEKGPFYFNQIRNVSWISAEQHFNCMIDLFGRTGNLKAANELLLSMPGNPDPVGWISLLCASNAHGNLGVGKLCFGNTIQCLPEFGGGYVFMSNLYVDSVLWKDEQALMEQRKSVEPGNKPTETYNKMNDAYHLFRIGDTGSLARHKLHASFDRINWSIERAGYVPHAWTFCKALSVVDENTHQEISQAEDAPLFLEYTTEKAN
ncbi:hypothetical protein KP509_39G053500 [Ceratopteris richardii]|nr:hypothetical protein KP509_39G053500 [Ceratopteris richardii]